MIHQHQWKRRCSVFAETFCVTAICVSGWVPVTHWMNQVMVAAFLLCVWVLRVKECPHLVQRQRVVPLLVVPFLFICPVHTGHRGLLGVTGKANQHPATTLGRRSGGLKEKRARIRSGTLFKPALHSLISRYAGNQTHFCHLTRGNFH